MASGKVCSAATAVALAGCNALGNLGATGAPTPILVGEPAVRQAMTPEPTTLPLPTTPNPWATGTGVPWVRTPTPVAVQCEAWDGSKPKLRGEVITLPSDGGMAIRLIGACRGYYDYTGEPLNHEIELPPLTELQGAYGIVDEKLFVLLKVTRSNAIFKRIKVDGNKILFDLWKRDQKNEPPLVQWFQPFDREFPDYKSWTQALPGAPRTIAGDVARATEYTAILTPTAEARWGAPEIDFSCVRSDGKDETMILRKTAVGRRYAVFMRVARDPNPNNLNNVAIHHGAVVLTKDGQRFKTRIFGPPVASSANSVKNDRDFGLGMPVWDEELGGFVTSLARATEYRPRDFDYCGPICAYSYEKLPASLRLITEDEIEASLEDISCGADN